MGVEPCEAYNDMFASGHAIGLSTTFGAGLPGNDYVAGCYSTSHPALIPFYILEMR